MATIGQPPRPSRTMPHRKARAKASRAAASTSPAPSQPSAVARFGPRRSGVSTPRRKSPTSLNRLVPIWIRAAASAAASSGSQRTRPLSCQATAVPTSTGDSETESVFGRQARNQAVAVFIREGRRGKGEEWSGGFYPSPFTVSHGQARAPQIMRLATKWRAGGKRSRASRPRPRASLSGPKSLEKARTIWSVNSALPWRSRRRRAA